MVLCIMYSYNHTNMAINNYNNIKHTTFSHGNIKNIIYIYTCKVYNIL